MYEECSKSVCGKFAALVFALPLVVTYGELERLHQQLISIKIHVNHHQLVRHGLFSVNIPYI